MTKQRMTVDTLPAKNAIVLAHVGHGYHMKLLNHPDPLVHDAVAERTYDPAVVDQILNGRSGTAKMLLARRVIHRHQIKQILDQNKNKDPASYVKHYWSNESEGLPLPEDVVNDIKNGTFYNNRPDFAEGTYNKVVNTLNEQTKKGGMHSNLEPMWLSIIGGNKMPPRHTTGKVGPALVRAAALARQKPAGVRLAALAAHGPSAHGPSKGIENPLIYYSKNHNDLLKIDDKLYGDRQSPWPLTQTNQPNFPLSLLFPASNTP